MAPKKRKAASRASTPAKKVRIGETSDIPDISPVGRPRRTSVGVPQYNFTRPKSSVAKQTPSQARTSEVDVKPKRRGRPPKSSPPVASPEPVTTENIAGPEQKKRGRPAKGATHASTNGTQLEQKNKPTSASLTAAAPKTSLVKKQGARVGRPRGPKTGGTPKAASPSSSESEEVLDGTPVVGDAVLATATVEEDIQDVDQDVQYWLMKAEPESRIEKGVDVKFSIDDLAAKTEPEGWDGVRNAVARNNMRAMRKGDLAFFYHSNCPNPGIAGVMRIVAEHTTDQSAFDPAHPYYDPKSDEAKPKWELVHVEFVKKFDKFISLKDLKTFSQQGGVLANMQMLKQSRLSVSSVAPAEWRFILGLAGEKPSLGHVQGEAKDGYESDVDGEGEETAAEGVGNKTFDTSLEGDMQPDLSSPVNGANGAAHEHDVITTAS
ncbi:hypothetical protein PV08_09704 [Exophiala spinifera]|uniref:Thymocyte nuclear protein 1 n=1 Tax=Exophiala spinifera TaxID=91928 RepID=A0A0D1ZHP2_9EURO|nr:uncharacterized protein PV08_09704 [Exophiala spinifera]KIW12427.1 hypothetical protein PV08_09704 [Exophiala spinifera]